MKNFNKYNTAYELYKLYISTLGKSPMEEKDWESSLREILGEELEGKEYESKEWNQTVYKNLEILFKPLNFKEPKRCDSIHKEGELDRRIVRVYPQPKKGKKGNCIVYGLSSNIKTLRKKPSPKISPSKEINIEWPEQSKYTELNIDEPLELSNFLNEVKEAGGIKKYKDNQKKDLGDARNSKEFKHYRNLIKEYFKESRKLSEELKNIPVSKTLPNFSQSVYQGLADCLYRFLQKATFYNTKLDKKTILSEDQEQEIIKQIVQKKEDCPYKETERQLIIDALKDRGKARSILKKLNAKEPLTTAEFINSIKFLPLEVAKEFLPHLPKEVVQELRTQRRSNEFLKMIHNFKKRIPNEVFCTLATLEPMFVKKLRDRSNPDSLYNREYKELISGETLTTDHIINYQGEKLPYEKIFINENELVDNLELEYGAHKKDKTKKKRAARKKLDRLMDKEYRFQNEGAELRFAYIATINYKGKQVIELALLPLFYVYLEHKGRFITLPENIDMKIGEAFREVFPTVRQSKDMHMGAVQRLFHIIAPNHYYSTIQTCNLLDLIDLGLFRDRLIERKEYFVMAELAYKYFKVLNNAGYIQLIRPTSQQIDKKKNPNRKGRRDAHNPEYRWENKTISLQLEQK